MFPTAKFLKFFLISVNMDLENKVIGFSLNRKGVYPIIKDSTKIVVLKERDMLDRKDCDPSVWGKCRDCSTIKTENKCLCYQDVEAVRDINLQVYLP